MRKQLRIFLSGLLIIIPLGVTVFIVYRIGSLVDLTGRVILQKLTLNPDYMFSGLGAIFLLVSIYILGLLTRLWFFQTGYRKFEAILTRLPGIKTIYESVRDLMKLFGGDSGKMGRVVQYTQPGTDITMLGLLTNENPVDISEVSGEKKVAVYLPYAYMIGGPTVYVSPDNVKDVCMTVEQALKIAAIANVTSDSKEQPTISLPTGKKL